VINIKKKLGHLNKFCKTRSIFSVKKLVFFRLNSSNSISLEARRLEFWENINLIALSHWSKNGVNSLFSFFLNWPQTSIIFQFAIFWLQQLKEHKFFKHGLFYTVFHADHENMVSCYGISILTIHFALKSVKNHILCSKSAKKIIFFKFRVHFRNPSLKIHLKMYLKFIYYFS